MSGSVPTPLTLVDIKRDNREWFRQHQPQGTSGAYGTYWTQFTEFCALHNQPSLPADPDMVAFFMRWLTEHSRSNPNRGLGRNTINKTVLAAIAQAHVLNGLPSPTAAAIISKIKRTVIEVTPRPKSKNPLHISHFIAFFGHIRRNSFIDVRDYFLLLLMFLAILRRSEAVSLRLNHVYKQQISPGHWVLVVWVGITDHTKTDRGRDGEYMLLDSNPTDRRVCPCTWHTLYLEDRRAWRTAHSDFLFVDARPGSKASSAPLTGATANTRLKVWATAIGCEIEEFSSGSARHGGATAIAAARVPRGILKQHGRWKSEANLVYIHTSLANKLLASRAILDSASLPAEVKIVRPSE